MLIKLLILCISIILYPIILLVWKNNYEKVHEYFKDVFSNLNEKIKSISFKGYLINRKETQQYVKLFKFHFNPQNGLFPEKVLRSKVYKYYYPSKTNNKNYKELRRGLAEKFYPEYSKDNHLKHNEKTILISYYLNNFPENIN